MKVEAARERILNSIIVPIFSSTGVKDQLTNNYIINTQKSVSVLIELTLFGRNIKTTIIL